ncbi:dolichyl-P-Glc:Glc(2)Man(9)GlcNAc(2)-PP-dolichol alpha-1,2- glucosyltransferase [Lachancea thermotolerans CBS 6340]|uniref:Dol-P-Glc:Glc(2)Man(9)GlcNAc(2)-PP-Dol alpha-1,2-glucosyltransferase n=1 Tax=Lachancea thermotolerans (strain ATCC 56472 / CBS 6340 / NRRL Y-8284) TaxID=559295 RepID=C5DDK7_LACTC|nr:KLTH0C01782p [Lachancea thermotolerans CBS 6340]CAR21868.1 KLTH0C01782p [Lachancea thermotolerans CBS 6340]
MDTKDEKELTLEEKLENEILHEVEAGFLFNLIVWPILLVYFGVTFAKLANSVVPYQFIDEVFHVKQTIQYIGGNWKTWDPKITTPPGLYVLGWLNYKWLRLLTSWSSLTILRLTNLFGGMIILPLVVLRPLFLFNAIGFWPASLICFPLMASYYYLYYTDVWSSIFILESLTLAITLPFGETTSIWLSALSALVSCLFRQTNIVWNIFIMVVVIERRALIHKDFNNVHFNNYLKFIIHALENFKQVVLPYGLNLMLFAMFVIYNRSLTLGDKDNHTAGIHLTQMFYCITFIAFFSAPLWISKAGLDYYRFRVQAKKFRTFLELLGIMLVIRFFSVVHPFLLADNRHYTFYLFKKVIARNFWFKYLLMPWIYHFSTLNYIEIMRQKVMHFHPILPIEIKSPVELPVQLTHISWTALIICTFMTVVPSPLFEPRYYILPYFFWRLFVTPTSDSILDNSPSESELKYCKRLALEFGWFMCINVLTLCVFALRSFMWEDEVNPQRVIW